MSIEHKTSVIALNLIKKDLTNEVSIAMIDDAIKIINKAEATEKELEEVKAMIKEIGDSCVSFDTSHQRVVFEALMNKVGRK